VCSLTETRVRIVSTAADVGCIVVPAHQREGVYIGDLDCCGKSHEIGEEPECKQSNSTRMFGLFGKVAFVYGIGPFLVQLS
jgi:hypothetical protein